MIAGLLISYTVSFSQSNGKLNKADQKYADKQLQLIAQARDVEDHTTAIIGYYNLLSIGYNDSLVYLNLLAEYFKSGQYNQCYQLGKKLDKVYRNEITVLDLYARSAELTGRYSECIILYDKLYALTGDCYYAYMCAHAQLSLTRLKEGLERVQKLLSVEDCTRRYVTIEDSEHRAQEVPVMAALYNLAGAFYELDGNTVKALEMYQSAVTLLPEFAVAKNNLTRLVPK